MKGKYYTPNIEEFHVGFEVEILDIINWPKSNKEEWKKHICSPREFYQPLNFRCILENPEDYRVKFLDKEDLETLGFTYNEKQDYYVSEKTYRGISTGDDKKLIIDYDFADNHMVIYYKSNRGEEYIKFEGTIKNLTELKMILKMVL